MTPLPASPAPGQNQLGEPEDSVAPPAPRVDFGLTSDLSKVASGQQFNLTVTIDAGPGRPVDAAQAYLEFDAAVFRAIDITPGPLLPLEFQSQIDNGLGQANYAAGTMGDAAAAPFSLATVRFTALAPTGTEGTTIGFAPSQNPRWTKSAAAGRENAGNLGSITIVVE
jgi:hypothetical protein